MSERPSWAAMNGDTPILDAESTRLAIGSLWTPDGATAARPGRRPSAGDPLRVSASSPTPDTRVHVAPGQSVLAATRGRGEYITTLDTTKSIDILTGHPADSANARWDLIIHQQADTFYGDPATGYVVRHISGTPLQQPEDPHVDGSPDFDLLARIRVPAQATAIPAGMIEDLRPDWTVALGGLLPVANADARAAITAPYEGQSIYRMDRDWVEIHDGTAWRVKGVAVCSSTTDRDATITSPSVGQLAITTDTGLIWEYLSGAWTSYPKRVGGEFRAGAVQSLATGATKLSFPNVLRNNGITVIGNSTFQVPIDGLYAMSGFCKIVFPGPSSGSFSIGGSTYASPMYSGDEFSTNTTDVAKGCTRFLLAGTNVCAYFYNNDTARNTNFASRPAEFSIWRVG